MYYEINFKKLNKIIGEEISWDGVVLNEKTLKNYILQGEVVFDDLTPVEEKILRQAAQLVINNKEQRIEIELNFGNEQGLPTNVFKTWSSVSQFLASKYQVVENIVCNIEGEKSVVIALVGKFAKEITNPFEKKVKLSSSNISWEIGREVIVQGWGDKEYAIRQIKKSNDENIKNTFNMVDIELWKDISFMQEIFIHKSYSVESFLPKHVLEGDVFINLMCQDMKLFAERWSTLREDFKEIEFLIKNKMEKSGLKDEEIPNSTSLLANLSLLKDEQLTEELQNKLIKVEKIWNNIFNDKDKCLKLLESNFYDSDSTIRFFSPSVQLLPEVIDKTFLSCIKKVQYSYYKKLIYEFVPKEYFENEEKTMSFLKLYINGCFNGGGSSKVVPKHIRRFYENKECNALILLDRAKEVMGINDNRIYSEIYSGLSKDLKESKTILKKLIELNDPILQNLSEKNISKTHISMIKKDKEIQNYILEKNNYKLFSILPIKLIYEVKDKAHIIGIIKSDDSLLANKETPKEWREDIDIVTAVDKNILWVGLTKTELKKLTCSEENTIRLIDCNYKLSDKFPKEVRQNPIVGLKILSKITERQENIDYISLYVDRSLWANYDFCYKALGLNKGFINMVPINYWNNGDFIKGVFKQIDNQSISSLTLDLMPIKIKQCLDSYNINVGELEKFANQFFSKQTLQQNLDMDKSEIKTKKLKL